MFVVVVVFPGKSYVIIEKQSKRMKELYVNFNIYEAFPSSLYSLIYH